MSVSPLQVFFLPFREFKFEPEHLPYPQAKASCEAQGGRLAEPRTLEQFNALTLFEPLNDRFFLGGSDLGTEGVWLWNSDNTPINLQRFFNANQPGPNPDEDCLAYRSGGLNDFQCPTARAYACEFGSIGPVPLC